MAEVNFLSPMYFLFLLAIPFVIFLYLLRTRRQTVMVPSVYLWKRYTREEQRYSLFKKILRDILLILQILIVILITLGLVRPAIPTSVKINNVVFIIDTSCSMQSKDIKPSRFELVRNKALEVLDSLDRGTNIALFSSDSKTRFILDYTADRGLIKKAINSLSPTDTEGKILETLTYIEKMNKKPDIIYLFTDGAFGEDIPSNLPMNIFIFAKGDNNVGITSVSARDIGIKGEKEIFINIQNFSSRERSVPFQVWEGERLVESSVIDLEKNDSKGITVGPKVWKSMVRVVIYPNDELPADDRAYLTFPKVKPSVLLVTASNPYLEIVLSLADVGLIDRVDRFDLGMLPNYDIVVFDGTAPNEILPGNYIFIGKVPENLPLQLIDVEERPVILRLNSSHPVMRFVDFDGVDIKRSLVLDSFQGESLVTTTSGSILWSYEGQMGKMLVLGFYPEESSLIDSPSFPILIKNTIDWLGENPDPGMVSTGEIVKLRTKNQNEEVTVTAPYGVVKRNSDEGRLVAFGDTFKVGVYSFKSNLGVIDVGANLCSSLESDISPKISNREFKIDSVLNEEEKVNLDLWSFLAMAALGVLFLEGYLFYGGKV
ncbi:MAG: BatA domain-containing protein [Dictyoglomi bacterium]|nr:BatA domain-containing protein [Dictyoglomota bacterium]